MDQKFLDYPQTGGKPFHPGNRFENKPQSIREDQDPYISRVGLKRVTSRTNPSTSLSDTINSHVFNEGDKVQHERFGNGKIISIEGQPPNTTATVEFDNDGKKKLLLRFAKLKKLTT
jgi:DNA helicase-2/ATP-dependent DNA helicase PcrA